MQVPEGDLERVMHGLTRIPNIDGVLVTMPHKFAAYTGPAQNLYLPGLYRRH
jgi:shikimate dehydrogenase